jgi:hypothetical protein
MQYYKVNRKHDTVCLALRDKWSVFDVFLYAGRGVLKLSDGLNRFNVVDQIRSSMYCSRCVRALQIYKEIKVFPK